MVDEGNGRVAIAELRAELKGLREVIDEKFDRLHEDRSHADATLQHLGNLYEERSRTILAKVERVVEESRRDRERLRADMEAGDRQVSEALGAEIKKMREDHAAEIKEVKATVKALDDWKRSLRSTAFGIAVGSALGGGTFGAILAKVLPALFG